MAEQATFPFPTVAPTPRPFCGAPGPRGLTCGRDPHADERHSVEGVPPEPCAFCGAPAGKDCPVPEACVVRWQHARRTS